MLFGSRSGESIAYLRNLSSDKSETMLACLRLVVACVHLFEQAIRNHWVSTGVENNGNPVSTMPSLLVNGVAGCVMLAWPAVVSRDPTFGTSCATGESP
jgi:hypothetical protein